MLALALPALVQTAPARAQAVDEPVVGPSDLMFWLPDLPAVVERGGNALLVTGYAWHNPSSYGHNNGLNAWSWGGGYSRWFDHADGRSDMLFAMGFSDSNRNFQFAGGVGHFWQVARVETTSVSLGYAAGFTARQDIWNGAPFPFLLPVLDLRLLDRLDIYFTYIPPLPTDQLNGNKGNVAFMFLGLRF
ncbi:hypothetical protein V5F49_21805 [Xanthobacter sp. V3C-3]|uniref:hypothetical protein n=1 Tax=Xanthobacter lutulentifluminis TaxID=3119935 RepID=UPI003726738A